MATLDPNQPSVRAMSMVKIKNNVTDKELRKTLTQFEVEKSAAIYMIDHDRLDMKDFLKTIKHCGSDNLPEARHWLRDGVHFPIKTKKKKKMVAMAADDDAEGKGGNKGPGDDMDPYSEEWQNMDPFARVRFAAGQVTRRGSTLHMDIYSRRNMLSSIDREVKRPPPPGRLEAGTGIRRNPADSSSPQILSPVDEKLEEDGGESVDESKSVKFAGGGAEMECRSESRKSDLAEQLKDIQDMERMVERLKSPLPLGTPQRTGSRGGGRAKTPKTKHLPPATAPAPAGERGEDTEKVTKGRADILVIDRDGLKTPKAREISRAADESGAAEKTRPKTQGADPSGTSFLGKVTDGFHHKTPRTAGRERGGGDKDLMTDLLHRNSRRKYRKKKPVPIEDRLKNFYGRLDDERRRDEAAAAAPISDKVKRQWTLLTQGIDAALALSSDEEDGGNRKKTA